MNHLPRLIAALALTWPAVALAQTPSTPSSQSEADPHEGHYMGQGNTSTDRTDVPGTTQHRDTTVVGVMDAPPAGTVSSTTAPDGTSPSADTNKTQQDCPTANVADSASTTSSTHCAPERKTIPQ